MLATPATAQAGFGDSLRNFMSGPPPKLVVVLLDTTSSIPPEDWAMYRQTLDGLTNEDVEKCWMKPGDRLVMAAISAETLSTFRPRLDLETAIADTPDDEEKEAARLRSGLVSTFDQLKASQAAAPAAMTNIIETIRAAQDVFQRENKRKDRYLIILSDMIEESKDINFRKTSLTADFTDKLIARQKAAHSFPDLRGIKIFVVGAGGDPKNSAKYPEVKEFWMKYLTQAGAVDVSYGRTAIDIGSSK